MKAERLPFQPISADIDDARLEKLAHNKGVSTLVKPSELPQSGQGQKQLAQPEAVVDPETIPTPRNRMKNVNIEIPDYVWTELKVRAAHAAPQFATSS